MTVFLVVTAAHRRRTEKKIYTGGGGGGGSGLCNMVQPLTLYIPFWTRKVPLSYTFFDKWYPHTKCTKKKRKNENTLQNKIGKEAFNRNHKAYKIRLPQLQLMMATHAEKTGKSLELWIQKSVQLPSKERLSCKCHYLSLASFTYPV